MRRSGAHQQRYHYCKPTPPPSTHTHTHTHTHYHTHTATRAHTHPWVHHHRATPTPTAPPQGFTDSMYNLTRRADGSARPSSELLATATIGGRTVRRIVSPKVASVAQAHFGCATLPGAQLEDDGGLGSALTHWEYNLFQVRGHACCCCCCTACMCA